MTTYYVSHNYYGDIYIHAVSHGSIPDLYDKEPGSLEELQNLLDEYPNISHVSVPYSWYGYGATHATLANTDYLEKHYSDVATSHDSLQWIVSREVILAGEHDICSLYDPEFWEGSMSLDDDATYERQNAALVEELSSALKDKLTELGKEFTDEGILFCADNSVLDYPEDIFIDNDGYTPYVSNDVVETIAKGYSNVSH